MPKEQPKNLQERIISIEEAAEIERKRQQKLSEIRKRIEKVVGKLKNDGYKFELQETSDEFILMKEDRETHLIKSESFMLRVKDKPDINASIEEMITADIVNPTGSSYDNILELRSRTGKDN